MTAYLQWQVVIGMEAEQIIESVVNYIWFLRVANAVCIWHLLLIDKRTPVGLWRHEFAFLVTFNQEKLISFVNSIKRIRAGTFLEFTSLTTICNNLTAKLSFNECIKWFAICASALKLTDLIKLISIFRNVQDHKLYWDTVGTVFNGIFVNYALLKKRGLVIVETEWSTWKPILFFHNMHIKSSFVGER